MGHRFSWILSTVLLLSAIAWVASKTSWTDTEVPSPMKGEALTNSAYAVQRFADALGARTTRDRVLSIPPADSVIVLSAWHWSLTDGRRDALEHWVEGGGRLVVDTTATGGEAEFERWSGIGFDYPDDDEDDDSDQPQCRPLREEHKGAPADGSSPTHLVCHLGYGFLADRDNAEWTLRSGARAQAMRVSVGRGSVTVINTAPFGNLTLFDGDHGWLFVAATGLRRGDDVHFLSEDDHPSLLALLWQHGGPVVTLLLALLAVLLVRGSVRLGPLAAPTDPARRSLAEQIRGTGQFALRHGSDQSLHAAEVRALDEAARRRIPNYVNLSTSERATTLAKWTGFDRSALGNAVNRPGDRANDLRHTIALLEAARRQILIDPRTSHGTD
jgi:hypothetical protein